MGSRGKSTAGGGAPDAAGSCAGVDSVDYWLDIWAFGTSPYGLGLTPERLWGLCHREYSALQKQWERARSDQLSIMAALRADLHNTAGKTFKHNFKPQDFMPGASPDSIEATARLYIEMGYTPSEAAAMATSSQTKEHNLYIVDSVMRSAKARPKRARRLR